MIAGRARSVLRGRGGRVAHERPLVRVRVWRVCAGAMERGSDRVRACDVCVYGKAAHDAVCPERTRDGT